LQLNINVDRYVPTSLDMHEGLRQAALEHHLAVNSSASEYLASNALFRVWFKSLQHRLGALWCPEADDDVELWRGIMHAPDVVEVAKALWAVQRLSFAYPVPPVLVGAYGV
jgi:hypothetical protein